MTTRRFSYIFQLTAILLASLLIAMPGSADSLKKLKSLHGKWKFNLGNDPAWASPDYDDSGWDAIYVPSSWEDEGFRGYSSYAWYRKAFKLKPSESLAKTNLYLFVGFIDDVDEVYVNGTRIGNSGKLPPDYQSAHNVFRKYLIPQQLLKPNGDNLIAVKVYDHTGPGGILGDRRDIGLYTTPEIFEQKILLSGTWKFKLHDDMAWKDPDYNDDQWANINVPGYWEHQGYPGYDGFAWYRRDLVIPEKYAGQQMIISLGKIDDLDEVYINGQLVGRTGNIQTKRSAGHEWQENRGYYIPEGVLRFGQSNTIAVRVYDTYGEGGIHAGLLAILSQKEYTDLWRKNRGSERNWNRYFDYPDSW